MTRVQSATFSENPFRTLTFRLCFITYSWIYQNRRKRIDLIDTNPLTRFIDNIPNKTFGLNICMGIRIRILLITNTYHLARVILLHRAFLFSTTKSEWEINLFIQAESEVEIVRFCLVVRCVFCIKEEEVEDKLCSNTWNSTFIFAL